MSSLQEPKLNSLSPSLVNIETAISGKILSSYDALDKAYSNKLSASTTSLKSEIPSRPSSQNNLAASFQKAIMSFILDGKILIKAKPDTKDFSNYSLSVSGSDYTLETETFKVHGKTNKAICLRSYKTNILKIEPSLIKPGKKSILFYNKDTKIPQKFGKVKKAKAFSKDLNIYDASGKFLYSLLKENSESTSSALHGGLLSSLFCGSKANKNQCGRIVLVNTETQELLYIGSYYTIQIVSNRDEQSFTTLGYELKFPEEVTEEARILITAALLADIPKTVSYKGKF